MTSDEYIVNEILEIKMINGSLKRQVEELRAEQEKFLKLKETIKRYGIVKKYLYSDTLYIQFSNIDDSRYSVQEKVDYDFLTSVIDFETEMEEEKVEGEEADD